MYDLYSKFDTEQHKLHYKNYLEVVVFPDGHIEYAVPSHQEKLIAICCEKLKVSRDTLSSMCPEDYYFNFIVWLCNISGCISLWDNYIQKSDCNPLTKAQYDTLNELKNNKLFKGDI